MPGPSNMVATRGFGALKQAYNHEKVVNNGLNVVANAKQNINDPTTKKGK